MQKVKYIFLKQVLIVMAISTFANLLKAQDATTDNPDKETNIQTMIDDHRFVFTAQSAHPTRGQVMQLNGQYDLKISPDTVRGYLPYFGRAYSAPVDGRGGGIDFVSKDFHYRQKNRKRGGWEISVKPKDINDIREVFLTIFENGSASLRVFSNNREVISYNGYLRGSNN